MDKSITEAQDLPLRWQEVDDGIVYSFSENGMVSFSYAQVRLGLLYDPLGKHLRAIRKGFVAPKGSVGLVPSEEPGYDFKSKVLGKGGDRRFHGTMVEGRLEFPGKMTNH